MQDTELYRHVLGLEKPWKVDRVELGCVFRAIPATFPTTGLKVAAFPSEYPAGFPRNTHYPTAAIAGAAFLILLVCLVKGKYPKKSSKNTHEPAGIFS
jgi:hypothetical protein